MLIIPPAIRTLLKGKSMLGADAPSAEVIFPDVSDEPLVVTSVRIHRDQAALAQRASFERPNVNPDDPGDPGYFSPDRGDDNPEQKNEWYHVLMPGQRVQVKLGYGSERVTVITGAVDEVTLDAEGPTCRVQVECRDDAWCLLDKTVSDNGKYSITYEYRAVEEIAHDLLVRAGIAAAAITTEATGIMVLEKTFEGLTYAEALEWCLRISGFELVFDGQSNVSFHYPTDRQPEAKDEALILTGTAWTALVNPWVVAYSDRVESQPGGGVLYSRETDYEIAYGDPAKIRRREGSSIPDEATVYATYVHAAWSFREGEDLFRLPYHLSRRKIYGKIIVIGAAVEDGEPVTGIFNFAGSEVYGVPPDKVLFVEFPELDTEQKCQTAANQLGNDMIRKVREVEFAAVGNPWVQVGDCVRISETSSTISEIYRVTSLEHDLDAAGFMTHFVAYHYGYTPLA